MKSRLNGTHDVKVRSWVKSANVAACDFPIQNLPFGVFDDGKGARVGIAIGDQVLDLVAACAGGFFETTDSELREALDRPVLNALMELGPEPCSALRHAVFELLREGSPAESSAAELLRPAESVRLFLPVAIGGYTDFYASIHHATNVGKLFRPGAPLPPNYQWMPIAYHGRASSIVLSSTPVERPFGQWKPPDAECPVFAPSERMDYEAEIGIYIGTGSTLGKPVPLGEASAHMFGLCLLNDWSARDIQAWESQPLGPFLAKNFLTTVSPWVVTAEALAPYRVASPERQEGDPGPLDYLNCEQDRKDGAIDIIVEADLSTEAMRAAGLPAQRVSRGSFREMYWTIAQMIAHHTANGCPLETGDLMGSGTISGEAEDARGCLLELTRNGRVPLRLGTGETRRFLEDGDEVRLTAYCERSGFARIGFGSCLGQIRHTRRRRTSEQ